MKILFLPNYTLLDANRRLSGHGGLIIYMFNDFTQSSALFESLFMEIWRKISKYQKYIIANIILSKRNH